MRNKPIELKEKALELIDCLCDAEVIALIKFNKDGSVQENRIRELLERIYMIAHAARDTECEHTSWERDIETTYAAFQKDSIL